MKILVCGNYGAGNLGDEMILEGILAMLKSQFPKAHITILSGNPIQTAKKYNCQSLPHFPSGIRSHFKNLLTGNSATKMALEQCDYFILGGGGLFGGPEFQGNLVWLAQARAVLKAGKKLIMYGQSVGKISELLKNPVKEIFQKASLITVRDQTSQKNLQQLGIKKRIFLIPDLAFHNFHAPKKTKRKREVLICLRSLKILPKNFKNELANFVQWLITKNYSVKFINFQSGKNFDQRLHQSINRQLKKSLPIITPKNPEEVLEIFSKSQYAVSMRLHSIISAIKSSTPFIALNYAPKVWGILKDLKLSAQVVEINKLEKLKKHFINLEENKQKLTTYLKSLNTKLHKDHLVFEKKLKALL